MTSTRYAAEMARAVELARGAGEILDRFYDAPPDVAWKGHNDPVTGADHAANEYLVSELARSFPGDGILAEESRDDLARLARRRVWLVDPLDGTNEFIDHNGEFCVMIGLVDQGRPVLGVIYRPVNNTLYTAAAGEGSFVEDSGGRRELHVSTTTELSRLRPVMSRSHRSALMDKITQALGVQPARAIGSLGLKSAAVAQAEVDFYVHASIGPKEWDTCAPEVIVREAGGRMTDCWDRPLPYNQRNVGRPFGVLASNGCSHAALAAALARVLGGLGISSESGFN